MVHLSRFLLFVLFILAGLNMTYGQKQVKIGDTVPDIQLSMINYEKPAIKLSELKGKAIIIDFWATWCAPCVASFPKLDSLQKKFGNQLIILPVTQEDTTIVGDFATKYQKVKKIKPFSVVNGKKLSLMFPHSTVPHYVWLDKNLVVRAITYPEDVTSANVSSFIEGKKVAFSFKSDSRPISDPFQPIFKDSSVLSYEILTKYIPGMYSGYGNTGTTVTAGNAGLLGLFKFAYGEGLKFMFGWSKTRLITKDSTIFTSGSGKGHQFNYMWLVENGYNYALKVPVADSSKKWEQMRSYLNRYFPFVSAKVETENRECYVLKRLGNNTSFQTTDTSNYWTKKSPYYLSVHNGAMKVFVTLLSWAYQTNTLQIIDETGYTGRVNIHLEAEISKPDKLNAALLKYGLTLQKEKRPVEILVVKDLRDGFTNPH